MVQRARSLAIAGKNADVEKYAVMIDITNNTANLVKKNSTGLPESMESLTFTETSNLHLEAAADSGCSNTAVVIFKNDASEPILACDGVSATLNPATEDISNTLKITLEEKDVAGNVIRTKTFETNILSGAGQVE